MLYQTHHTPTFPKYPTLTLGAGEVLVDAAARRFADRGAGASGHQDARPQGDLLHVGNLGGLEGEQRAPPRGEVAQENQPGRKLLDPGRRQRGPFNLRV